MSLGVKEGGATITGFTVRRKEPGRRCDYTCIIKTSSLRNNSLIEIAAATPPQPVPVKNRLLSE
jgi:hypothetical protein